MGGMGNIYMEPKKIPPKPKNSAKMAQSVERHTRNVQVRGSIPRLG